MLNKSKLVASCLCLYSIAMVLSILYLVADIISHESLGTMANLLNTPILTPKDCIRFLSFMLFCLAILPMIWCLTKSKNKPTTTDNKKQGDNNCEIPPKCQPRQFILDNSQSNQANGTRYKTKQYSFYFIKVKIKHGVLLRARIKQIIRGVRKGVNHNRTEPVHLEVIYYKLTTSLMAR